MYEHYFGFREPPFRITPDPRFLYRNPCVEEAAAALAYGIERRKGFCTLVGEAGTGKTTLLRHVLDTLSGNVRTVLLLHPTVEFDEILEFILSELGIPVDGARKLVLLQRLHEFLLEHTHAGGNVALLIDEAQDLEPRVLEELRLLSNLETGTEKILQIVLAGQPELEGKLADPGLRQLRQRIALHVRLRALSGDEIAAYVRTRLELAGAERTDVFTPAALARIATLTQGIPRIVNVLCDACLVTAYAMSAREVTPAIVDEAWVDYGRLVGGEPLAAPPRASEPVAPPPAIAPVPPPAPERPPVNPIAAVPADEALDVPPRATWSVAPRQATIAIMTSIIVLLAMHAMRTWTAGEARREAPAPAVAAAPPLPAPAPVAALPDAPIPAAADAPPTLPEARAVVHEFLLAYEALDAARLAGLFAEDGTDNGRTGPATIRAAYEQTFDRLVDVVCTVPRVEPIAHENSIALTSPFIVVYREKGGPTGELRGTAEWEIGRRSGAPRIVGLRYAFGGGAS